MTAQEIVDALSTMTRRFPREALSEAPQHREELIPHLLDSLDYVCGNADKLIKEESPYDLHFYAMYLLAQFREKKAFPRMIRLLRMDKETVDYFLGDVVTEGASRCLCSVYDGNLGLLKELIEDTNADVYARNAALDAYGFITRGDATAREEMIDYLRRFIYGPMQNDTGDMPTFVASVILDEHFFELIPDVKILHDRELIDTFAHGDYDGFLDFIFSYSGDKGIFIDNVVTELQYWAKYKEEPKPKPKLKPKQIPKQPAEMQPAITKKKIGRNDPCPCGSGKKYKKCCLPLGVKFNSKKEEEEEPVDISDRNFFKALMDTYDQSKPYDLLQNYPPLGPPSVEGQRTITEFYSPKAIEIDILVYKAICHRSIPLFVKRDHVKEDLERIDFLLEAFAMFTQVCEEEHLETFADFDQKYMVHYESTHWVSALSELLEKYEDNISTKKYAALEAVNAALARMSPSGLVTRKRSRTAFDY